MNRDEHGKARVGRITGSRIKDILNGDAATLERMRRVIQEDKFYDVGPNTPAPLAWGKEHEKKVQAMFDMRHPELELGDPEKYKFLPYWDLEHPLFAPHLGVSPDRVLVDSALPLPLVIGGLETKAPYVAEKHQAYRHAGVCPPEYVPQCQFSMFVTNTPWWWFASGDPRETSDEYRYFEVRVERDLVYHEHIRARCTYFLERFLNGESFITNNRVNLFKGAF